MAKYKNVFPVDSDVYVKPDTGSTERKVIDALGFLVRPLETVTLSSAGLSPSSAVGYGITLINVNGAGDPSTSPRVLTLGAPVAGVEKTIILDTTAAYVTTVDIDLGAGCGVMDVDGGSTTYRYIAFSSLGTLPQSVTLLGMSTVLWAVKCVNTTVGNFGLASGIRTLTAARTS